MFDMLLWSTVFSKALQHRFPVCCLHLTNPSHLKLMETALCIKMSYS